MKKVFCYIIIILSIFSLTACQKTKTNEYHIANINPAPIKITSTGMNTIIGETDYSNIVVYTENESYPINTKKIFCFIRNNNIGKGFYYYDVPYIEHYKSGKWIRLDYQPPELILRSVVLCGEENNTTHPQKTKIVFKTKFVKGKIRPGDYRLVIFVGDKILYAPFKFTK